MSWDVVLLKFRGHDLIPFDVNDARRIVLSAVGWRETDEYEAEITTEGIADVYFDARRSPEILFTIRASSPGVTGLIFELARELKMVVFFPIREGWGAAVAEETAGQELPDRSWSGWEDFGEGFDHPEPVVCRNAGDLEAATAGSYRDWAKWAHKPA